MEYSVFQIHCGYQHFMQKSQYFKEFILYENWSRLGSPQSRNSLALLGFSCIIVYQSIYFLPEQAFRQYSILGKPGTVEREVQSRSKYVSAIWNSKMQYKHNCELCCEHLPLSNTLREFHWFVCRYRFWIRTCYCKCVQVRKSW